MYMPSYFHLSMHVTAVLCIGTTLPVIARAVLKGKPKYRQSTRRAKDTQPRIKRIALTEPPI